MPDDHRHYEIVIEDGDVSLIILQVQGKQFASPFNGGVSHSPGEAR